VTRIVAIDTTSEFGSLAAGRNGRVVEEMLLHSPDDSRTSCFHSSCG